MDNDVVVTVGHKVKDYVRDPRGLTVRLGDWNPNEEDSQEEHPHIEVEVDCVKVHPEADLSKTLANNVAVLKLKPIKDKEKLRDNTLKAVLDVVDIRNGPRRPANNPEGVEGSSVVKGESMLDRLLGLGPLGAPNKQEVHASYINTICLPKNERQFENYREYCWVAAWGQDLKRQREVDLPLVSRSECERRLGPVFKEKRVKNWRLQPSEICAGGVPGKDTCKGEGGAPLVCYDKVITSGYGGKFKLYLFRILISTLLLGWLTMALSATLTSQQCTPTWPIPLSNLLYLDFIMI